MNNFDSIAQVLTAKDFELPSVFEVQTATHWMQKGAQETTPKKLFGSLWLEGELSILYADTGIGKTILAMQIAENISTGQQTLPFENQTQAQKVLYLDFELTYKQFQMRYSDDNGTMYPFNENFLRAELGLDDDITDAKVMNAIESEVITKKVKVLVVDNITYLKNETEKGSNALPLMKQLNQLKKLHGLSILVLAHTPKRDETRPIVVNDLYGSKMISNFVDGAFAIGRSHDGPNLRYIKQVKCRSNEIEYFAENVALVELVKPDSMTRFKFIECSDERIHLKQLTQTEDKDLINQIYDLAEKGFKQQDIANQVGRSLGYVNKHIKIWRANKAPF